MQGAQEDPGCAAVEITLDDFQLALRVQHVFLGKGGLADGIDDDIFRQIRESDCNGNLGVAGVPGFDVHIVLIQLDDALAVVEEDIQGFHHGGLADIVSAYQGGEIIKIDGGFSSVTAEILQGYAFDFHVGTSVSFSMGTVYQTIFDNTTAAAGKKEFLRRIGGIQNQVWTPQRDQRIS